MTSEEEVRRIKLETGLTLSRYECLKIYDEFEELVSRLLIEKEESNDPSPSEEDVRRILSLAADIERIRAIAEQERPLEVGFSPGLEGGTIRVPSTSHAIRIKSTNSREDATDFVRVNDVIGNSFPSDIVTWVSVDNYLFSREFEGNSFSDASIDVVLTSMFGSIRKIGLSDQIVNLIGRDNYKPRNLVSKSLEMAGENGLLKSLEAMVGQLEILPDLQRFCDRPFLDCAPWNKKFTQEDGLVIKEFDWSGASRELFFRNYDLIQHAWYLGVRVLGELASILNPVMSRSRRRDLSRTYLTSSNAFGEDLGYKMTGILEDYSPQEIGSAVVEVIIGEGEKYWREMRRGNEHGMDSGYDEKTANDHLACGLYWQATRMANRSLKAKQGVVTPEIALLKAISFPEAPNGYQETAILVRKQLDIVISQLDLVA